MKLWAKGLGIDAIAKTKGRVQKGPGELYRDPKPHERVEVQLPQGTFTLAKYTQDESDDGTHAESDYEGGESEANSEEQRNIPILWTFLPFQVHHVYVDNLGRDNWHKDIL